MKKHILLVLILFATSITIFAQNNNTATVVDTLKVKKQFTTKVNVVNDSISDHLNKTSLKPLLEGDSLDSNLIIKATLGKKNSFYFMGIKGTVGKDYIPLTYSKTALLNTKVVFAGYGLTIKTNTLEWDDYKGVDVKGKWVMILRGRPDLSNNKSRYNAYYDERTKISIAEVKGASGVIFITPVEMNKNDGLIALNYDKNALQTNIPVVNITRKLADSVLTIVKKPLIEELENKMNTTKKSINFIIFEKLLIGTDVQFQKYIGNIKNN